MLSSVELWYVLFTTCGLLLAGNAKLLLERAGLIASANLVSQQLSAKAVLGINRIFTANTATFFVWCVIGLMAYSLLSAFLKAARNIAYIRHIDSPQYVHPVYYTHRSYWRQVIVDASLHFLFFALLIAGGAAYVIVVIPLSFVYTSTYILQPSLQHAVYVPVSLAALFLSTAIVYVLLRLVIRNHRVTSP